MTPGRPSRERVPAVELVALDIDGTVLTPEQRIAESTCSAITAARDRGARLVLASSRGPVALEGIQTHLSLRTEWFIGYQGALVARWAGEELEVLASTPLDGVVARAVEDRAIAAGLSVGRYIGCRWRVPRITAAIELEASVTGESPVQSSREESDGDAPPQKVLVIADGERELNALRVLANSLPPTVTGTFSHPNYLEITAAGVDKAHGLRPLITHLGLALGSTAAVGDGLNDLALFAAVAYPIAMGQAAPTVRSAARWVTASNSEDGVARALDYLGLTGRSGEGLPTDRRGPGSPAPG